MKVTVVGAGYVGLSIATLLSVRHNVVLIDVDKKKVDDINNRISPLKDDYIERYFNEKKLYLTATTSNNSYTDCDFIVIAVPTNYNEITNRFDTYLIEGVIEEALSKNTQATFVIKSTVPIGYCDSLYNKYGESVKILFSPEFLRETKALYDNLHPSRIIIGRRRELHKEAATFATMLSDASLDVERQILYMGLKEAESVKLFANTYLAMRVAFFNELDNFALFNGINTKDIIEGISLDPRIEDGYNNPSFGYGGYCLPKDTKQLLTNYANIRQSLIGAIVESNEVRKRTITKYILEQKPKVVGINRLVMKSNSDNFRSSAIQDIICKLQREHILVVVYEPQADKKQFGELVFVDDINTLKRISDIILTNRYDSNITIEEPKAFSRDLFGNN